MRIHNVFLLVLLSTFIQASYASGIPHAGTVYAQINAGLVEFSDNTSTIIGINTDNSQTDVFMSTDSLTTDSSWLGEGGLGVYALPFLRFDLMVGVLGMTDVSGEYHEVLPGPDLGDSASVTASLEVTTQFLNGYLIIPSLFQQSWFIKPYIGAGVGMAQLQLSAFSLCIPVAAACIESKDSNTVNQFAWRVIGGLELPVTEQFLIDFAYRYMNAGRAKADDETFLTIVYSEPLNFDVKTQEIALGFRFIFK